MKNFKLLFSFLLLIFTISAYADIVPMQVVTKCNDGLKPVAYSSVAISTTGETPGKITRIEYKVTDGEGYFYLDDSYHGKLIQVYLADKRSIIIVDCRSRLTPIKTKKVLLGEIGSMCPGSFCRH